MYLLDTCVISDLRRAHQIKHAGKWFQALRPEDQQAHRNLIEWSETVDSSPSSISAVTAYELEQGVLRVERRDPKSGALLRNWLDQLVLPKFAGQIVAFDERTARICAFLHVPNIKSYRDAMIGASAIACNLTLVTRNISDFVGMIDVRGNAVKLCNPYSQKAP